MNIAIEAKKIPHEMVCVSWGIFNLFYDMLVKFLDP